MDVAPLPQAADPAVAPDMTREMAGFGAPDAFRALLAAALGIAPVQVASVVTADSADSLLPAGQILPGTVPGALPIPPGQDLPADAGPANPAVAADPHAVVPPALQPLPALPDEDVSGAPEGEGEEAAGDGFRPALSDKGALALPLALAGASLGSAPALPEAPEGIEVAPPSDPVPNRGEQAAPRTALPLAEEREIVSEDVSGRAETKELRIPARSAPASAADPAEAPAGRAEKPTETRTQEAGATAASSAPPQHSREAAAPAPVSHRAPLPPAPPPPADQVRVALHRAVQDGTDRVDIRLEPERLGKVEIRLEFDRSGKVTAHFTVERPETLTLLRHDSDLLSRQLADAGFREGGASLSFALRDNGGHAGHDARGGRGRRPSRSYAASAVAAAAAAEAPQPRGSVRRLYDLRI